MKKILIALSSFLIAVTPVTSVVACGSVPSKEIFVGLGSTSSVSLSQDEFNKYNGKNELIRTIGYQILSLLSYNPESNQTDNKISLGQAADFTLLNMFSENKIVGADNNTTVVESFHTDFTSIKDFYFTSITLNFNPLNPLTDTTITQWDIDPSGLVMPTAIVNDESTKDIFDLAASVYTAPLNSDVDYASTPGFDVDPSKAILVGPDDTYDTWTHINGEFGYKLVDGQNGNKLPTILESYAVADVDPISVELKFAGTKNYLVDFTVEGLKAVYALASKQSDDGSKLYAWWSLYSYMFLTPTNSSMLGSKDPAEYLSTLNITTPLTVSSV